jgi:quercetin dioxygenase-like cupin family protein
MEDEGRLSFLSNRLPPAFAVRVCTLEPGTSRPFDPEEWRDALVVVEQGEVDLECHAGGRRRFRRGAMLSFAGLSLRRVHNAGAEPVVLVAVSRQTAADG